MTPSSVASAHAGVVVYLSGIAMNETFPEQLDDHSLGYFARKATDATPGELCRITSELLGEMLPVGDSAVDGIWRLDVVWWVSAPEGIDLDEIAQNLAAIDVDVVLQRRDNAQDPWSDHLDWPKRWHVNVRSGRDAFCCTREARSFVRLWLVASEAPYENEPLSGGHSISSLLETDDETGRLGALADYIRNLARERQHRVTSVQRDREVDSYQDLSVDLRSLGEFAELASESAAQQQQSSVALATTALNLDRTLTLLSQRLDQLAISRPLDDVDWQFAASDRRQWTESIGTVEFNATRAAMCAQSITARLQHRATVAAAAATRANSFAMMIIAVAAGAFSAGALADENRTSWIIAVGCVLFAFGVLAIDASATYAFGHFLVVWIALGIAVAAHRWELVTQHPGYTISAIILGSALAGWLTCWVVDVSRVRLGRFLARPVLPRRPS